MGRMIIQATAFCCPGAVFHGVYRSMSEGAECFTPEI